ncbi:similar to Saccharomyces cerevisiae YKR064W OAF3 Zinc cluster protein [Maudiozyma saulgeensis]|uniref:Oleate activated transcription factor 3 n=1 Tax=Maudiozyma saulgeensis TaxID=1789683 RepID=A0A1X7R1G7_9SACH|nr:similar to Saccharomyces cerevisiae YKR064W OAF3 Zinc cluster protein [Kazachstania saulgeensis]
MSPEPKENHVRKRRNRRTVVCTNCRKRKSKCDKQNPCNTCAKYGDSETCTYVSASVTHTRISKKKVKDRQLKKEKSSSSLTQGSATPINIIGSSSTTLSSSQRTTSNEAQMPNLIQDQMSQIAPTNVIPIELDSRSTDFVDFIPSGHYLEAKRSATTIFSLFTDISMEHRDPYLTSMIRFRSIAIKKTMNKFQETTKIKGINPNLPNSFIPLSTFDRDDIETNKMNDPTSGNFSRYHKQLFEKFAKYRKDSKMKCSDEEYLTNIVLPDKELFKNEIIPIFTTHILHMMPFVNMNVLQHEIDTLYEDVEKNKKLDIKKFDHMVYSIVLLITILVQLSLKFQKTSLTLFTSVLALDTTRYIAIVSHFLFQMKVLRKCTLLQLYCLMLLRFYFWCAPEDGDGTEAQHNRVLMGTIISSAKEMGINWSCFSNEKYFFKITDGTRPSLEYLKPEEYKEIFRSMWAVILFWDRKMGLINGQECFVGKTFPVDLIKLEHLPSWYTRVVYIDSLLLKINDLINDSPSRININALETYYNKVSNEHMNLKASDDKGPFQFTNALDFEFEWMLDLFKLSIAHAKMISYEYSINVVKYHESAQQLWDQLVIIAQKCYIYFYESHKLNINPFNQFYSNRIVEIISNKLCVLIPAFILRFSRMSKSFETRKLLCKFFFAVASMYFNEFSADYYRCFRKMFTAKIVYKILDRPEDRDPWEIILRFLVGELNSSKQHGEEKDSNRDTSLKDLVPLVYEMSKFYENDPDLKSRTDFVEKWNNDIYPIGKFDTNFSMNFREEILTLFLDDRYPKGFNLFASFYDNTSCKLSQDVDSSLKPQTDDQLIVRTPGALFSLSNSESPLFDSTSISTMSVTSTNGVESSTGRSPGMGSLSTEEYNQQMDRQFGNLDLLDDIFDPLDFISYFN